MPILDGTGLPKSVPRYYPGTSGRALCYSKMDDFSCFMLLKNGRFFVLYTTKPKKSRPTTGAAKRISECEWPVKGKKNISKQNNKRANEDAFILLQHAVISVVRALMIPFA